MPFCIQYVCIGVAVLQDQREEPVFPRWLAYYNFWVAIGFIPTGLIGFFHRGPFAWHGLLGFWVPVAIYGGWFLVMTHALRRAIGQERTDQSTETVMSAQPGRPPRSETSTIARHSRIRRRPRTLLASEQQRASGKGRNVERIEL